MNIALPDLNLMPDESHTAFVLAWEGGFEWRYSEAERDACKAPDGSQGFTFQVTAPFGDSLTDAIDAQYAEHIADYLYEQVQAQRMEPENGAWTPQFSAWRHGGWYVNNIRWPKGGCGCVSRNYIDKKWRIVCDPRRSDLNAPGDFTFKSRDAAARAERDLAASK